MPCRRAGGDEGRRSFRTSSGFYFVDDGVIDVGWLGATSLDFESRATAVVLRTGFERCIILDAAGQVTVFAPSQASSVGPLLAPRAVGSGTSHA